MPILDRLKLSSPSGWGRFRMTGMVMDAERRHQLRENDLAHGLTVTRDFFEQHSKQITVVAVTALAIFIIGSFLVRSREQAQEDMWRQRNELKFENAQEGLRSVDQLLALVKGTSDRRFIVDGLIQAGRESLRLAKEVPFPPDRELNGRARAAFEELLRRFPGEALPAGVALSGLATVEENDFVLDHDVAHKEKAREYLMRLSSDPTFHGLPFQRVALDRLKMLDSLYVVTEFAQPPPAPPPEETPTDPAEQSGKPAENEPAKIEPAGQP